MRITAGSLKINGHTKPTLPITLQTLNILVFKLYGTLLTLLLSRSLHYKALKYEKLKNTYTPMQRHLQTINITEVY